jgi:RHS repeat-associated protein
MYKVLNKSNSVTAFFVVVMAIVNAQQIIHDNIIILDQPDQGNKVYMADERIEFLPGYSFTAGAGNRMEAFIGPYGNLFSSADFNNHQLDPNLQVGSIQGTHQVTESGGFVYNIPIELPHGANGVTPQLSLTYNSQAGNGTLGMGWSLQGLSAISRSAKSIYYDDEASFIKYNNDDAFKIDGNRLFKLSNSQYIFGTELEDFSRIFMRNPNSPSDQWFELETKEGQKIEYGRTSDSKLINGSDVLIWMVSKVIDTRGNFYEYEYETINNELRIKEIRYGFNSDGHTPLFKIVFSYSPRADSYNYYLAGKKLNYHSLLTEIKIIKNGDFLNSYVLGYGMKTQSYLNKIERKYANAGTLFNPTIFKYELNENNGISIDDSPIGSLSNSNNTYYYSTDILGDGKSDLLEIQVINDPMAQFFIQSQIDDFERTLIAKTMNFKVLSNSSNDDYDFQVMGTKTINSNSFVVFGYGGFSHSSIINEGNVRTLDFDGDGKSDLMFYEVDYNSGTELFSISKVHYYRTMVENGQVDFEPISISLNNIFPKYISNIDQFSFIGDFNGDGIQDVLYVTQNDIGSSYWSGISKGGANWTGTHTFGTMNQRVYSSQFSGFDELLATAHRVEVIDFNGDGKSDLFIQKGNQVKVFTFEKGEVPNVSGGLTENLVTLLYESNIDINNAFEYEFGDFNGDGKSDLVLFKNNESIAYFSSGVNFEIQEYEFPEFVISGPRRGPRRDRFFVQDITGNGKSEIICVKNRNFSSGPLSITNLGTPITIEVYEFNGNSFSKSTLSYSDVQDQILDDIIKDSRIENLIFGDFFARGITSIITPITEYSGEVYFDWDIGGSSYYSDFNTKRFFNFNIETDQRHLSKIKNGLGNSLEINYTHLKHASTFGYEGFASNSHFSPNYPIRDFVFPLKIVGNVLIEDGLGDFISTEYDYYGGKMDMLGKGFLGFSKTEIYTEINDLKVVNEKELDADALMFLPTSEKLIRHDDQSNLSQTNYLHTLANIPNNRYRLINQESESIDYISEVKISSLIEYDVHNNIERETVLTLQQFNQEITSSINEYTYDHFASSLGFANRPTTIVSSVTRVGEDLFSSETILNYNHVTGDLILKKEFVGTPFEVTEEYDRNNFGNVIKTTASAIGLQDRISETVFDNRGRLPIITINEMGQEASIQYHPLFDKPVSITDVDGLISTSTYDNFGRLVSTTDKYGIVSTIQKEWVNTNPATTSGSPTQADDIMYKVIETRQGEPSKTVHYNRLGQPRMQEVQGFNAPIYTVTTYNNKGQVIVTTEPFLQGASTIGLSETVYDEFNRISSVIVNGQTVGYTYAVENGLQKTTTIKPDGTSHTTFEDAAGNLVKSEDNGGLTEYSYFSHGGVKEIKVNNDIVATSEYDILGRQIKLIDVNAGTIEYSYNAFGNIIEKINANGEVKTYQYDDVGRPLQTNEGGFIVEYQYIESGNGLNQVERITAPNHEQLFEYDGFNRVIKTTEIIDGNSFEFEYTYNSFNQLFRVEYPNGVIIANAYDNNGYLTTVLDNNSNTTLWTGIEQDALGRFVKYQKGDGVTTELSFDLSQNLVMINAGNVQQHIYEWHAASGNLIQRQDLLKDLYEEFQYDNLNRLRKVQDEEIAMGPPPNVSIEIEYSANGNISFKSDAGDYAYDAVKTNAVIGVTNDWQNITNITQEITYNAFNKVASIEENTYELDFLYGYDKQRRKTLFTHQNVPILEKYFVGLYEMEVEGTTTRHINYVMAGDGVTALIIQEEENGIPVSPPSQTYFMYKDHLGSIVALTDAAGDVVFEQSFDAWGRYRNPEDWTYDNITESPTWLRGYTGHEHLPHFDLINMNGRIYDPILGRMLSPDRFVQDPLFSQSYNRYSYAWNNPLRYTDPSGEIVVVGLAIGTIVGAYIGGAMANNDINIANWEWNGSTRDGIVRGAMFGAFVGVGIGGAFSGAFGAQAMAIAKSSAPVIKSGLLSGGMNMMYNYEEGQSFGTSMGYFASGFAGGVVGIQDGTLIGMLTGGFFNMVVLGMDKGDEATNREYAQKFVSGAINSYTGISTFSKPGFGQNINYLKMADGSYFGGSKLTAKAWRAGWLNQASDFAHSSQGAFESRSFMDRVMMFGAAGASSWIGGVGQDGIDAMENRYGKFGVQLSRQIGAGYFDYHMQQTIHSTFSNNPYYMPWRYNSDTNKISPYSSTKLSIQGYKSLFYGLKL